MTYTNKSVLVMVVGMKPGARVPALEVEMKKILLGTLTGTALLMSAFAPALAQHASYPGQCTGYPALGACMSCCQRLHPGNTDCTNACRVASPASDAKAMMSPKRK